MNATGLSCFSLDVHGHCSTFPAVEQIQAHVFGEIASGTPCRNYKNRSEVLSSDANPLWWCKQDRDQQEFTYRFAEINPVDPDRIYPHLTDRIITVSSGTCYEYSIDMKSGVPAKDLNGNMAAFEWQYTNGTVNGSVLIPTAYSAYDSTTYIYNGTQIPQDEVETSCGPRCMWIWAFRANSTLEADKGQNMALFQCPITVGTVQNVTKDSQNISDGMAKLAATAIALQGRNAPGTWTQYQLFPWG